MLTLLTQTAIVLLCNIAHSGTCFSSEQLDSASDLISKLVSCGLVRLYEGLNGASSYELTRFFSEIPLLDVFEATGGHLDCHLF